MKFIERDHHSVAVVDASEKILSVQAMLDLMADAHYQGGSGLMVIYRESLGDNFFDLSTGFAGEILQKFSNYRVRLAIVGNFEGYKSKALHDFIYECNQGNLVFFKNTLDEALTALLR